MMDVQIEKNDHTISAAVTGHIDGYSAAQFETIVKSLLDHSPRRILLDFSGLDYVSSAGLRVILSLAKACKAGEIRFAVAGLKPAVLEIFKVTGFTKYITIFPDLATALSA